MTNKKQTQFPDCFLKFGCFKKCQKCPFAQLCKRGKAQLEQILKNTEASE